MSQIIQNATVVLRETETGPIIFNGVTDNNGIIEITTTNPNILLWFTITAADHIEKTGSQTFVAGQEHIIELDHVTYRFIIKAYEVVPDLERI